jgi:threonine dehydrogenase-like Zn-dependent dehydrogenase
VIPISFSQSFIFLRNLEPQKPDEATGVLPFPMGLWWIKGQTIRGGFAQIRLYQELLKNLIERGNAKPSFVFSKEYRIEDAAQAYKGFEAHKIIKAVFKFDVSKKGLKRKSHHDEV